MSLRTWIGRQFGLTDRAPWSMLYGGAAHSGKAVTIDSALQLATFWACVRLTAGAIASMPLAIYERRPDGSRVPADHALRPLLTESPDGERTAFEFWEACVAWLLTTGNAYAEISRIGDRIVSLTIIPSDRMQVIRRGGVLTYVFTVDGKRVELHAESVLHLRGFGFGGDLGLSVIRHGVQTFGSAIAAEETAGKILANGMMPSGVVSTDQNLTEEQAQQLRSLTEKFTSSQNAGKVLPLPAGLKFEQLSLSPEDGQLLATRGFSVEEICRWFGTPPVAIGHSGNGVTAWGTGIESLILQWLTTGLNPLAIRLEKRIGLQLLAPGERAKFYAEFNREGLLQADSEAKMKFLSGAVQNGLMSRNEARGKLNLARVDGGDALTAQTNLAPLDKLGGPDAAATIRTALGIGEPT